MFVLFWTESFDCLESRRVSRAPPTREPQTSRPPETRYPEFSYKETSTRDARLFLPSTGTRSTYRPSRPILRLSRLLWVSSRSKGRINVPGVPTRVRGTRRRWDDRQTGRHNRSPTTSRLDLPLYPKSCILSVDGNSRTVVGRTGDVEGPTYSPTFHWCVRRDYPYRTGDQV